MESMFPLLIRNLPEPSNVGETQTFTTNLMICAKVIINIEETGKYKYFTLKAIKLIHKRQYGSSACLNVNKALAHRIMTKKHPPCSNDFCFMPQKPHFFDQQKLKSFCFVKEKYLFFP